MALVDLRDRQDEPAIRSLIALDVGPAATVEDARGRYADRSWVLVGWSDDAGLVGYIGVERLSDEEIALRTLAVAEPFRRQGHGRAMLDALLAAATAERVRAEAGEGAVGFFRSCGFTISSSDAKSYACVRQIRVEAAPDDAVAAVTLADLEAAIRDAWSRDTSEDPKDWTEQNPACGQCGVTALLVRELLGGEILVAGVVRDGRRVERHAWNRLSSGFVVDLTRDQFRGGELFEQPVVDEPIDNQSNRERFALLRARVETALSLESVAEVA